MTQPDDKALLAVMDATWPAAEILRSGPFTLRNGQGGGNRVSAATLDEGPADASAITAAAREMRALDQTPLFMVQAGETDLDAQLDTMGYVVKEPVVALAARVTDLAADRPPPVTSFEVWPPLACQVEIWAKGGIGPERLAIMERVTGVKTSLLGRCDDTPAGTAFVARLGRFAMLHALEITMPFRRRGMGRHLMTGAAFWAQAAGATHLLVLCTRANTGAKALYASMGFTPVGSYHYRIQKDPR